MKILLVNPPCRMPVVIPLGLGYIASTLRQSGHEVSLVDLNARGRSFPEIERELADLEYDLIGIGGLTTTYKFVKQFSSLAKKIRPDVKIIAGNMVSTAHPQLLLKNSGVDICVIDEGEATMNELASRLGHHSDIGDVAGIVYKEGGRVVTTGRRERIRELDSLPFPAWDLFEMETYLNNPIHNEYGRRSINISTVRGCPFQCVYCSRPFGSAAYKRSAESVIEEIRMLKRRYGVQFVGFSDDLFIIDRIWVGKFCDAMIDAGLDIGWGASARVNLVNFDLLKKMRRAGCEVLGYGFESGSQRILDLMNKGVKVRQAEEAVYMTRKAGITIEGSFMIGMIGETEETVKETIDFVKRTGLALHKFFYTTPYPATPLYDIAKRMGRLPPDEDAYVSSLGEMYNTLIVNLTEMPNAELKNLKERAERQIKANFGLRARLEILADESKRISVNVKKHIATNGLFQALGWSIGKIRKRMGIWPARKS